jgi:hypothetical protein
MNEVVMITQLMLLIKMFVCSVKCMLMKKTQQSRFKLFNIISKVLQVGRKSII